MGRFFSSIWQAVREFIADDCMSIGAAIAYYAMFSLPPLEDLALAHKLTIQDTARLGRALRVVARLTV